MKALNAVKGLLCAEHSSGLFRCRLMSRSDVKRTACAGRNQNRQLMRGGRAGWAERRAAPKPDRVPSGDRSTYASDEGLQ